MFRAPFSEYMRLYGTVAPYLKSKFPHLKIGGYGHCGFYAGVGSDHIPAANSSPRMEYFVECSHRFLGAARDNEWLPYVGHDNLGSALQASGVSAELVALQNGPCDLACIYDASCGVGNYSPLFNPMTLKPHKAYYAFTAFNELRKRGTAVEATVSGDGSLCAAAARGGDGSLAVMVANDSGKAIPFSLCVDGKCPVAECRITDGGRTDEAVAMPQEMPPHSFLVAICQDRA